MRKHTCPLEPLSNYSPQIKRQCVGTYRLLPLQVIEVLEAEGKNLKGVRQEFVAKMLIAMADWKTASDRGLMSKGIIVLQKPVSAIP